MEITAQVLNNTILKPGEIFDYRKVIQEIETKYGYQPAPEIVNGQLQQGIGGGIRQVSSALYNVVLFSNLEVIERHNHSLPVSYVPLGRDKRPLFAKWPTQGHSAKRDGFRVNVYKMIKQNGKNVENTIVSQDTYRVQPTLIVVGIGKTS